MRYDAGFALEIEIPDDPVANFPTKTAVRPRNPSTLFIFRCY